MAIDAGCENTAIQWSWRAHDFAVGGRIRLCVEVNARAGDRGFRAFPFCGSDD